jgi:hypothetical protein
MSTNPNYLQEEILLRFSEEHLAYELEMFFATAAELLFAGPNQPATIKNALIESFLVHARAILFFFYTEKPKPDDVLAEHYIFPQNNWHDARPPIPTSLRRLQERVGKEVAHLTYSRKKIEPNNKNWDFAQIILEFIPVFQAIEAISVVTTFKKLELFG